MKYKKYKFILLASIVLIISILISSCQSSSTEMTEEVVAELDTPVEPIKIGFLNEQSGPYENWGLQEYRGFMVGLLYATDETMEINGRPIEVIVEDTTCDPGVAVQKATKLIEDDKVDILAGSNLSSIALAVMATAAEAKVPYVINGAASEDITGANFNVYTFRIGRTVAMAAMAGFSFLDSQSGIKDTTWVMLSPDYAGGRSGSEALGATVESMGGIVLDYMYPPMDAVDFTPYINRIKELKPDYITATLVGDNYTIKLPAQLREMGALEDSMLTTSIVDINTINTMGQNAIGMSGECIYHHKLFDTPANNYFIDKHKELYDGDPPDYWAGESFAGAQAIVLALKKAGSTDADAFIEAMEGLEYDSVKGHMVIRPEDHQALQDMAIAVIVDDGEGGVTVGLAGIVPASELTFPVTAPNR